MLPDILRHGTYEWEYHLYVPSFLEYYLSVFSKPVLEKITEINQKQFFHYSSGRSKPSKKTIEKIRNSIHHFASEMYSMHFV